MRPAYTGPPRRAFPALERATPRGDIPVLGPRTERPMVQFSDGTWHLCWISGWQRSGDGWLVELAWGERGVIRDGWFHYEPEKMDGAPG